MSEPSPTTLTDLAEELLERYYNAEYQRLHLLPEGDPHHRQREADIVLLKVEVARYRSLITALSE